MTKNHPRHKKKSSGRAAMIEARCPKKLKPGILLQVDGAQARYRRAKMAYGGGHLFWVRFRIVVPGAGLRRNSAVRSAVQRTSSVSS
jgi:hypothetical protein